MSEINEGWLEVSEEAGIEVEDIIRFDHDNKTYCVYKLEDGYYLEDATDGLCTHETVGLITVLTFRGWILLYFKKFNNDEFIYLEDVITKPLHLIIKLKIIYFILSVVLFLYGQLMKLLHFAFATPETLI